MRIGVHTGYGYSFESKREVRFAGVYPWIGYLLTDPVGSGWLRGSLEPIGEATLSYVWKEQRKGCFGANAHLRYNLLPDSGVWRPDVQIGFGVAHTNLDMDDFGTHFNFVSSAACGLRCHITPEIALGVESRVFHLSNAGLDTDNDGLNMHTILASVSRSF